MTDSIDGNTIIKYMENDTIFENSIEELFEKCSNHQDWIRNDKHYSWNPNIQVLTYDPKIEEANYSNFNYIYRHKTNKEKWEITSETGETIIVTNDHSCMVERDGKLIEVKPSEMLETDILIILEKEETNE